MEFLNLMATAPLGYARHTLVAWGGTLDTGSGASSPEIWECTVRGVQVDQHEQPVTDPVAYMNGLAPALLAWHRDAQNLQSSSADLRWLKVNTIRADGKYEDRSTTNRHDFAAGSLGGASQIQPPIISLCWSWRTAKTRGPGSHGRIYPPNGTQSTPGSMMVTSQQQQQHLDAAKRLLSIIQIGNGDIAGMAPCVCSRVNATNTPITEIWIGNVWDVQRRRKDALVELYTKSPAFT